MMECLGKDRSLGRFGELGKGWFHDSVIFLIGLVSIPVISPSVLRREAFGPGTGRGFCVSCCENMLPNDAAAMGCSPQPMTFLAPAVAP